MTLIESSHFRVDGTQYIEVCQFGEGNGLQIRTPATGAVITEIYAGCRPRLEQNFATDRKNAGIELSETDSVR